MRTYKPTQPPADPAQVPGFLRQELQRIQAAANRAEPYMQLQVLNASPAKTLPGMVVYADGTNWNPGSGEGVYRRNAANNAWAFLG